MRTVPPPASPETLMVAVASLRPTPTYSPSTLTVPPVRDAASMPFASTVPLTLTTPRSPPSSTMVPLRLLMVLARMMPSVLMTVSSSALALLRGEEHVAAVGFDGALVHHRGVERGFADGDLDQAVADHVERDLVAGGERHLAHARDDEAFVDHLRREQAHVAVQRGDRGALLHFDAAGIAVVGEYVFARGRVRVADRQRGGDDAAHVDRGARPEQHAMGIDEEELPGRGQRAEDVGPIAAR